MDPILDSSGRSFVCCHVFKTFEFLEPLFNRFIRGVLAICLKKHDKAGTLAKLTLHAHSPAHQFNEGFADAQT